jgi:cytochrome c oxidase subunit 3
MTTPSATPTAITEHTITDKRYRSKTITNRIGLWLFLVSDSFVFAGLLVARFYLMGNTRPELNQLLGLVVTGMLLVSSFFANRAEIYMQFGDLKRFSRSIMITMALGALFFIGVVFVEWPTAPFRPWTDANASLFYAMTGFHALHVFTGLVFLWIVYRNARRGLYTAERHWPVEAAAVYWHFIDVVWVFFYSALYLMGTVIR